MNKIFLLAIGALLLTACATPPNINAELQDCKSQGWWFCRGESQAPTITVRTGKGKLKVGPYCAKAVPESLLIFRLLPKGANPLGSVKILPKNTKDSHKWLEATNDVNPDLIFIEVPKEEELSEDDKYFYGIKIGDRCIDPRVHVKN